MLYFCYDVDICFFRGKRKGVMMKQQRHIFIAFFRSGMLGYGGGLSAIPLMHREVVGTFKWMDDEEFADVLALANTLPGPINTKLAGYIGWRIAGWRGRSEEHTSELQSRGHLVCRLLLEKKK